MSSVKKEVVDVIEELLKEDEEDESKMKETSHSLCHGSR